MARLSDFFNPTPKQLEALKHIGYGERVFFGGARGGGKMQIYGSKVCTPYGFRNIEDLKVGDTISNPDGSPQKVIRVTDHQNKDIYRIKFEDGAYCDCGLEHFWLIRKTSTHKSKVQSRAIEPDTFSRGEIMDTEAIIKWLDEKDLAVDDANIKNQYLCIPLCEPIKLTKSYKYNMRVIEPYILGLILGDGSITKKSYDVVKFTSADSEIIENIKSYGYEVNTQSSDLKQHTIRGKAIGEEISRLKLSGTNSLTKFIPESYKYNTVEGRIELIQGMMDTDGCVDERGHMSYTSISEQMAKDFQWIIRSLGGKATIVKDKAGYKNDDGEYVQCNDAYTVYFNTKTNPDLVRLSRKKERCKYDFNGGVSELQRRIVGYEYIGKYDARCIAVNHPNRLYVTDDFVVTHNSALSLYAANRFCLKIPGLKVVVIRENYSELIDNFIEKQLEYYPQSVFKYKYTKIEKTVSFPNGSAIKFRSCANATDARKIQGIEFQFMIIDEANNLHEDTILALSGSLRRNTARIKNFIPSLLMTGNPGGFSDHYFKTRFVNPDYKQWREWELKHKDKYIFVPSAVDDNPYIGEDYRENLENQPDQRRKMWLLGDWNTMSGAFFDSWDPDQHICESFEIPKHWTRGVGIDEGFTEHPTVALFLAQDPDTGRLYAYKEYAATGSIEEHILNIQNMIDPGEEIAYWVGDTSMFSTAQKRSTDMSSAMMYLDAGIPLIPANKDRRDGWRVVKEWLHWTEHKKPMLQIFPECIELITTLPAMRYDSSKAIHRIADLDTRSRDDSSDSLRYILLTAFGSPIRQNEEVVGGQILKPISFGNERNSFEENNNFLNLDGFQRDSFVSNKSLYV